MNTDMSAMLNAATMPPPPAVPSGDATADDDNGGGFVALLQGQGDPLTDAAATPATAASSTSESGTSGATAAAPAASDTAPGAAASSAAAAAVKSLPLPSAPAASDETDADAGLLAQLDPALSINLTLSPATDIPVLTARSLAAAGGRKADDASPVSIDPALLPGLTPTPTLPLALTPALAVSASAEAPALPGAMPTPLTTAMTANGKPAGAESAGASPTTAPVALPALDAAVSTAPMAAFTNILPPTTADTGDTVRQAIEAATPGATAAAAATPGAAVPVALPLPLATTSPFPPGPLAQTVRADTLLTATDAGEFAEAIGDRVTWLASQHIGRAEISLSPPELGPIQIRLGLDGHRVHAEFISAQPEVRAALEAGLPRLRDMLSGQGLQLSHAGVGSGGGHSSPGGNPSQQGRGDASPRFGELDNRAPNAGTTALAAPARRPRGMLDEYA